MSDNHIKTREEKWQKKWREARAFVPLNDNSKPKYYTLVEFPFPSGNGMHVGHAIPFVCMDIIARFKRMSGFDVLLPMGIDSMGISAEHYAKKIGKTPAESVAELFKVFERDSDLIGLSYNPESYLASSDTKYVKWTQWLFLQLYKAGLLYKTASPMNWCPSCLTTLTNEELEDGCCNRCHSPVEKKMKEQWTFAITKYADRLVDDLAMVDFPDKVKTVMENWVGRSYGAEVDFEIIAPPLGGGSARSAVGGAIATDTIKTTLFQLKIDARGLDEIDREYMTAIVRHYAGGPVGIENLSAILSEPSDTIEDVIEPYLMQQGFVQRTPRGRVITEQGYKHLGLEK